MIRSKPLWPAHYSTSQGFCFGGLDINNSLVHRAGAAEEVCCRWRSKGTHSTQNSCLRSRAQRGFIINHRGVIFTCHKSQLFPHYMGKLSAALLLYMASRPGARQSRVMPSSGLAAGCVHGQTVRQTDDWAETGLSSSLVKSSRFSSCSSSPSFGRFLTTISVSVSALHF